MKIITKEILRRTPGIGATRDQKDPVAQFKLFTPWGDWSWYVAEYDPESGLCFGLVDGFEVEAGSFSLPELMELTGPFGLRLERDLHWSPRPLSECART